MNGFLGVDWRDDRGQVAGIEAIPFGILLFVTGSLMVASFWGVLDCKMATTAAAREAARAYVEAPSHAAGLESAFAAASEALRNYGRNGAFEFGGPTSASEFRRCNRITFTVSYKTPAVTLPLLGGYGSGFTVTATHTEIIDPFRDNVGDPGQVADCA